MPLRTVANALLGQELAPARLPKKQPRPYYYFLLAFHEHCGAKPRTPEELEPPEWEQEERELVELVQELPVAGTIASKTQAQSETRVPQAPPRTGKEEGEEEEEEEETVPVALHQLIWRLLFTIVQNAMSLPTMMHRAEALRIAFPLVHGCSFCTARLRCLLVLSCASPCSEHRSSGVAELWKRQQLYRAWKGLYAGQNFTPSGIKLSELHKVWTATEALVHHEQTPHQFMQMLRPLRPPSTGAHLRESSEFSESSESTEFSEFQVKKLRVEPTCNPFWVTVLLPPHSEAPICSETPACKTEAGTGVGTKPVNEEEREEELEEMICSSLTGTGVTFEHFESFTTSCFGAAESRGEPVWPREVGSGTGENSTIAGVEQTEAPAAVPALLSGYVPTMARATQMWTPECFEMEQGPEMEVVTALLCHVPYEGAGCLKTSCSCCETSSQCSLFAFATWMREEQRSLKGWESEELTYGRLQETVEPFLQWGGSGGSGGSGGGGEREKFSEKEASRSRQKTVLAAAVLTRLLCRWGEHA